jgi:hypothetical protein
VGADPAPLDPTGEVSCEDASTGEWARCDEGGRRLDREGARSESVMEAGDDERRSTAEPVGLS